MRIHQIGMASNDLDATERFYRDIVGARYVARYDPPGLLFFDLEGVRLLFEKGAGKSVLYLWVDDIDAYYEELTGSGVTFEGPPHAIFKDENGTFGDAGETEWMAFFNDPSDNILALATRRRD